MKKIMVRRLELDAVALVTITSFQKTVINPFRIRTHSLYDFFLTLHFDSIEIFEHFDLCQCVEYAEQRDREREL